VALIEHIVPPRVLAAPLHRHSGEDEYSVVLEGRLGVFQDGDEVVATPGDVVFKPRDHWHTFWNAGDEPLRILELIAPGGIEELFVGWGSRAASTTQRHFPPSSRRTAVTWTSRAPCR